MFVPVSLQWRHNALVGVSNHQPNNCLFKRLFRRRSKKTSKLRVTGLYVGNSPVTGQFPGQMASNAENVSIWWRQHVGKVITMNTGNKSNKAVTYRNLNWTKNKRPDYSYIRGIDGIPSEAIIVNVATNQTKLPQCVIKHNLLSFRFTFIFIEYD